MVQKGWINVTFFCFILLKPRNQLWTKSQQHWSIDSANEVASITGFLKAYTRILQTKEASLIKEASQIRGAGHRVWDNQTHLQQFTLIFNTNFNTNTPGLEVFGFLQKAWNHPTNGSCYICWMYYMINVYNRPSSSSTTNYTSRNVNENVTKVSNSLEMNRR